MVAFCISLQIEIMPEKSLLLILYVTFFLPWTFFNLSPIVVLYLLIIIAVLSHSLRATYGKGSLGTLGSPSNPSKESNGFPVSK
jgi:hypothetical protein